MTTTERPIALITGAGGGVGRAVAERFGATHRLVLADIRADQLDRVAGELGDGGCEVVATHAGDLADATFATTLADAVREAGRFGVLVNAGGLSPSMADAWRIVDVNLFGTVHVLDALLPLVEPGTVGVCIASVAGWRKGIQEHDGILIDPSAPDFRARLSAETGVDGKPGRGYALSKRGVSLLVERRAADWGARGGRLVAVSPGLIADTPMGRLEAQPSRPGGEMASLSALRRDATASDVAGTCLLLAAPEAAYLTGIDVRVDGGVIPAYWHHASEQTSTNWDYPTY